MSHTKMENYFIHKSANIGKGYDKYIQNSLEGKWINFNFNFFLTQGFYFIYYKMYKAATAYALLFSLYLALMETFPVFALYSAILTTLITPFFAYKLQELNMNEIIDSFKKKNPTNYVNLFLNYSRAKNVFKEILRTFFLFILYFWLFFFGFAMFKSFVI